VDEPEIDPPSIDQIRELRRGLGDLVVTTPVLSLRGPAVERRMGTATPYLKLELFQRAGSFKARGALAVMRELDDDQRARGVTAVSAGNHAMAVGFAAQITGTEAKVVMPRNANPARIAGCASYGAEVVLVDDVGAAFAEVERIVAREGRTFVHPFEGPLTALGTATIALEFVEQVADAGDDLDALIVPIGGGGLAAGMATAAKLLRPDCEVFGVEPVGADSMHRSFAAGSPQSIERVRTIADSLGAPHASPYSFALCRRFIDELVMVDDDAIRDAMRFLFQHAKLAVEPAAAAATAALMGPLHDRLQGKRVGLVICGANIDPDKFFEYVQGSGPTTN